MSWTQKDRVIKIVKSSHVKTYACVCNLKPLLTLSSNNKSSTCVTIGIPNSISVYIERRDFDGGEGLLFGHSLWRSKPTSGDSKCGKGTGRDVSKEGMN